MSVTKNLQRDTLKKLQHDSAASEKQKELALLKIAYGEDNDILTKYINKLIHVNRIFPRILPTQASGRHSTFDPPITNWPRACISQRCQSRLRNLFYQDRIICPYIEHEWESECWSLRDILLPDDDEILITWDHDNIEGKIHDLILNDENAIQAHIEGYDLHTITCCNIFKYDMPTNLKNPHTSTEDVLWRTKYNWQGKDTRQRVLSKNFNHGSKYTETWKFVYKIKGIEQYGTSYAQLGNLAKAFIASKGDVWKRKLAMMDKIRRNRLARSLYGFRRKFYTSEAVTGREGFSHMVSATVSDYNNETLIMLEDWLGDNIRLLHNAHDGDKIAIKKCAWNKEEMLPTLKSIIERNITYEDRSLTMTAGVKVYT